MAITVPTGAGNVTTYAGNAVTSCVLAKPSNLTNGDLLVAAIFARSNTAAYAIPSGWSEIPSITSDNASLGILRFYVKAIADAASEPANYTWSGGGAASGKVNGVLFRATGVNNSAPLDVAGATSTAVGDGASGANQVMSAVAPTGTTDLLVLMQLAQVASGGTRGAFSTPTGMTRVAAVGSSVGSGSEQDFAVDVQVLSAAGSTGARTGNRPTATQYGIGYGIALKAQVSLSVTASMSPGGAPSSADAGVARTLMVNATGGGGNPITLDVDWGDGLTHDTGTLYAGTPKTFTRTPTVAGSKTAVITFSEQQPL